MSAHIHAALMAEYAKDAAETNTPWDRWEFSYPSLGRWVELLEHPEWDPRKLYRRKRTPLCQVEGRDVFPGDKLWWTPRVGGNSVAQWVKAGACYYGGCMYDADGVARAVTCLSWTEPTRTKTVYQWAYYVHDSDKWLMHCCFATDEQDWRERTGLMNKAVRLDYTALEVPA